MQPTSISVHKFRSNLKQVVESVIHDHAPVTVTRRGAKNFVVLSEEDWNSVQETLYVMQNASLASQIAGSMQTHHQHSGKIATDDVLSTIMGDELGNELDGKVAGESSDVS